MSYRTPPTSGIEPVQSFELCVCQWSMSNWPFTQSLTPSLLRVTNVYVSLCSGCTWPVQRIENVFVPIEAVGAFVPQSKSTVGSTRVSISQIGRASCRERV